MSAGVETSDQGDSWRDSGTGLVGLCPCSPRPRKALHEATSTWVGPLRYPDKTHKPVKKKDLSSLNYYLTSYFLATIGENTFLKMLVSQYYSLAIRYAQVDTMIVNPSNLSGSPSRLTSLRIFAFWRGRNRSDPDGPNNIPIWYSSLTDCGFLQVELFSF